MAGILIPVIIHLWNNQQGKVLPVGSIAFLEKGSLRQSRTRRLSEWWLLLLRCLLLLLLALLLSEPFWQQVSEKGKTKGWVLGVKEDLSRPVYQTLIDSLLKAGYQWHEWPTAPPGQKANGAPLPGSIANSAALPGSRDRQRLSYWDLFRAADHEAPAGIPFYIFTSGVRSGFTGERPVTSRMVQWYTYPPTTDAATHWIGQAWLSSSDSIRVLTGSSLPTGNSYSVEALPAKVGSYPGPDGTQTARGEFQVQHTNGHLSVVLDSQPAVVVDTATLRIRIYADNKYYSDSRYLFAGLQALKQFTRRNMQISIDGSLSHPDWIFWLSSAPLPAGLTAPNILHYMAGREIPVDSWMEGNTGVAVGRRVEPDTAGRRGHQSIWNDGFGRPILSLEQASGNRIYHFYSHFDPEWNGLVWNPRFPVLLEELMTGPALSDRAASIAGDRAAASRDPASFAFDRRVLDPEQIQPELIPDITDHAAGEAAGMSAVGDLPAAQRMPSSSAIDLAPACWILLFLLFLAERILSYHSPKIKPYG